VRVLKAQVAGISYEGDSASIPAIHHDGADGQGRPASSAALARNARRTWAGLTARMSTGPYVDLFTWPGGKPNTDVKSAPYHLSKSNQQREQHKCARA
jgi:hypothetical protein